MIWIHCHLIIIIITIDVLLIIIAIWWGKSLSLVNWFSVGAAIVDVSDGPHGVPATDGVIRRLQNLVPMRLTSLFRSILSDTNDPHDLVAAEAVVVHEQNLEADVLDVVWADVEAEGLVEDGHERVSLDGRFPFVLSPPVVK